MACIRWWRRLGQSNKNEWAEGWVSKSEMGSCGAKRRNAGSKRSWDERLLHIMMSVGMYINHLEQRMY